MFAPPKFKVMDAIKYVHEQLGMKNSLPKFKAGDNITVNYKIIEGNKERIQAFKGDVIQLKGQGATATFTVRKISNGVGVERVFPSASPNIESIEINKQGQVRRARIFYLRDLVGKKARIKEKRMSTENAANTQVAKKAKAKKEKEAAAAKAAV
jgi:large subunit ribosomal protein L19